MALIIRLGAIGRLNMYKVKRCQPYLYREILYDIL